MAKRQHTEAEIEQALRTTGGLVSYSAKRLGMTSAGVRKRIKSSARLQGVVEELDDQILDMAEGNVLKLLDREDPGMTRWVLEKKGKGRGYGPEQRINKEEAEAFLGAVANADGGGLDALSRLGALFGLNRPKQ